MILATVYSFWPLKKWLQFWCMFQGDLNGPVTVMRFVWCVLVSTSCLSWVGCPEKAFYCMCVLGVAVWVSLLFVRWQLVQHSISQAARFLSFSSVLIWLAGICYSQWFIVMWWRKSWLHHDQTWSVVSTTLYFTKCHSVFAVETSAQSHLTFFVSHFSFTDVVHWWCSMAISCL